MLYFSLTSPHTPLAGTDIWENKSGLNNSYADFVMQTDAVVGQILDELKANGAEDNTIVFFLNDNGCALTSAQKILRRGVILSADPYGNIKVMFGKVAIARHLLFVFRV